MEKNPFSSEFSEGIFNDRYAQDIIVATKKESWWETSKRVAYSVLENFDKRLCEKVANAIYHRKFIPGGRYLYCAGRPKHQVNNCFLFKAEDTREGWGDLLKKIAVSIMTGGGCGVVYSPVRGRNTSIQGMGGVCSGAVSLMHCVNNIVGEMRQGGTRRAALWGGLHWDHPDAEEFITSKQWSDAIKEAKEKDFSIMAPLEYTNISLIQDTAFFEAIKDENHEQHKQAKDIFSRSVRIACQYADPGWSFDAYENEGENLRNAPVCADTWVLTDEGYQQVGSLLNEAVTLWTGRQWATSCLFVKTKEDAPILKVSLTGGRTIRCDKTHPFITGMLENGTIIARTEAQELRVGDEIAVSLPKLGMDLPLIERAYTLGYLYGDGSFRDGRAEVTLCSAESKLCKTSLTSSTGFNCKVTERDRRGYTRIYYRKEPIFFDRFKDKFPEDVTQWEQDYFRASFIAGLFDADGNWEPTRKKIRLCSKHRGFLDGTRRLLESLGILSHVSKNGVSTYGQSQCYQLVVASEYNDIFMRTIPCQRLMITETGKKGSYVKVVAIEEDGYEDVYCCDVKVPEHCFQAEGVLISNCTEVTSFIDSDMCNLGSVVLSSMKDLNEFEETLELATKFLIAGTEYTDLPMLDMDKIRKEYRRIGVGLMGVHEWMMQRRLKFRDIVEYAPEFNNWMERYYSVTNQTASKYSRRHGINEPIKKRAIAPTGTISIVAETTSGIEAINCVAYKRLHYVGNELHYEYVIDKAGKAAMDKYGIGPDEMEDAYTLSEEIETRIAYQAKIQDYVDMGISSTATLPKWGTDGNNENKAKELSDLLIKYGSRLRGFTVYPDGSKYGQPIQKVSFSEAWSHQGKKFKFQEPQHCKLEGGCSE